MTKLISSTATKLISARKTKMTLETWLSQMHGTMNRLGVLSSNTSARKCILEKFPRINKQRTNIKMKFWLTRFARPEWRTVNMQSAKRHYIWWRGVFLDIFFFRVVSSFTILSTKIVVIRVVVKPTQNIQGQRPAISRSIKVSSNQKISRDGFILQDEWAIQTKPETCTGTQATLAPTSRPMSYSSPH